MDLISLDAVEVAKRAQLPVLDIRRLSNAISIELQNSLGMITPGGQLAETSNQQNSSSLRRSGRDLIEGWSTISTLDEKLDDVLGGGIPPGYITEITGESGAGKTQFLLTSLLSAQLPPPHGTGRPTMYISTEASLNTTRLAQLLRIHPRLCSLPSSEKPSLDRILSINVPDLESQDHIIRYQLPVSVRRHHVGLVIIDSVASNYRAELDARRGDAASLGRRSAELVRLGALLRELARAENVAVVVANQVADRFMSEQSRLSSSFGLGVGTATATAGAGVAAGVTARGTAAAVTVPPSSGGFYPTGQGEYQYPLNRLSLDHQQRWFTGWGDEDNDEEDIHSGPSSTMMLNLKTPSLGHTWTLQLSARIVLLKEAIYVNPKEEEEEEDSKDRGDDPTPRTTGNEMNNGRERDPLRWQRRMKVVFAPWTAPTQGRGVEFVIRPEGITSKAL
ncbi:MAG: hypothetical protein M1823_003418 [Watsoniomyces obsoletus]|nr:MAG: hypothetical protein M1823_003418 [Watsoniomyces obsoletus]